MKEYFISAGLGTFRQCLGLVLATLLWLQITSCSHQPDNLTVKSPDQRITVTVAVAPDGELSYQVQWDGHQVLDDSSLGFALLKQPALDRFEVIDQKVNSVKTSWEAVWGERRHIRNEYNELFIALKDTRSQRKLNVRFRAYDDGMAFRYEFPQQRTLNTFVITEEKTRFNLADDYQSWWIPADYDSYEKLYQQTPLSAIEQVQTPLTLRADNGLHISIHEAALTDYASMTLTRNAGTQLQSELVPWADGTKVKASTPFKTPWRTVQLASNAAALTMSDLILNLNEPNRLKETDWITPMKYVGIWWGIHLGVHTWKEGKRHGATTERAIDYIDFAADHNIQGVLFEGWNKGWEQWGTREAYVVPTDDFDLDAVSAYAKEKGIAIVGHNETGGNIDAYESHVEEIFSRYNELGINTVKTGYVAEQGFANGEHHQGQYGVNHYRRIVELAARYHLMIDAHEPVKDTGIRRTWPNMMTREGARGGEYNAWSDGNSADYTMILPFTRLLAGPMDYTPGIVDIDYSRFAGQRYDWGGNPQSADYRVKTTVARQLANMVIFYSPLQMAADMIENYRGHSALPFIEKLDMNVDDSQTLNGEIGKYITIARRAGERWFIGSGTNNQARSLTVSLDFLTPGFSYRAAVYADNSDAHWETNPEALSVTEIKVTSDSTLKLELAAGGGAAVIIEPFEEAGS